MGRKLDRMILLLAKREKTDCGTYHHSNGREDQSLSTRPAKSSVHEGRCFPCAEFRGGNDYLNQRHC